MKAAFVIADWSIELGECGLATTARGQLVQGSRDEGMIAVQSNAAEQYVDIAAGNVAAEGDAGAMGAQRTAALAARVAGCRTDPKDVTLPPGSVAPLQTIERSAVCPSASRHGSLSHSSARQFG